MSKIKETLFNDFPLLDTSRSRYLLVIFCGILATLFILIYNPLGVSTIPETATRFGDIIPVTSAGIIGALCLLFTQFVIRPIVGLNHFKVFTFILWAIFEFTLISVVLFWLFGDPHLPISQEVAVVFKDTFILALVPYGLSCLIIALLQNSDRSQRSSMHNGNADFITITDDRGSIKLVLRTEDLIMMKSENNYIRINFLEQSLLRQMMIRRSFSSLLQMLPGDKFCRVHRSYAVNLLHVKSVKKNGRKYDLLIEHVQDEIPVSETYYPTLQAKMTISTQM